MEDGPDDQKRPPRSPYGLPLDALQLGQMFANVVPYSTLEQVQKAIASGLLTQFRAADFIVPPQFKLAELVATARFADFAVPEGLLASWRQSLLLSETVTEAMWASSGLTDIQHQGHGPGKDVQNGDHGEEEAATASLVHSGVQS